MLANLRKNWRFGALNCQEALQFEKITFLRRNVEKSDFLLQGKAFESFVERGHFCATSSKYFQEPASGVIVMRKIEQL
jgi:hypothetical protein